MNKTLTLLIVGVLLIPVLTIAGTCGMGRDCEFCLTKETCEAQANCVWEGIAPEEECSFNGMIPFESGSIANILAVVGNLFTDLGLVVVLAVGLPMAFWVIYRVIAVARGGA